MLFLWKKTEGRRFSNKQGANKNSNKNYNIKMLEMCKEAENMKKIQTAFFDDGIKPIYDYTPKDLKVITTWRKIIVRCPWCLYKNTLDKFVVRLKRKRKGYTISLNRMRCPDCYVGIMRRTLLLVSEMEIEEYAYWFWENVFIWKAYERVTWDKLKARLNLFPYELRQIFWRVYREFKEASDKMQVLEDRENYLDYIKKRKEEETLKF